MAETSSRDGDSKMYVRFLGVQRYKNGTTQKSTTSVAVGSRGVRAASAQTRQSEIRDATMLPHLQRSSIRQWNWRGGGSRWF